MKKPRFRKYKITVEDESRLSIVNRWRITVPKLVIAAIITLILAVFLAVLVIIYTPLRNKLPGYMVDSQRLQIENAMLRVDSLSNIYNTDRQYIENLAKILNTDRNPADSVRHMPQSTRGADSLMTSTDAERKFIASYNKREKYNVGILSPLAASNMMFRLPCQGGVADKSTIEDEKLRFRIAGGMPVTAIADATVIEVSRVATEGGGSCVLQHANGFVSRYSHLTGISVRVGQHVRSGEVIALQHPSSATDFSYFMIQLWRHGDSLLPAQYLL